MKGSFKGSESLNGDSAPVRVELVRRWRTVAIASVSVARRSTAILKFTDYFQQTRKRTARARIRDEWILRAVISPDAEDVQRDGRIRRWIYIPEERRYLRVVLLADGATVHNAFFDRRFRS